MHPHHLLPLLPLLTPTTVAWMMYPYHLGLDKDAMHKLNGHHTSGVLGFLMGIGESAPFNFAWRDRGRKTTEPLPPGWDYPYPFTPSAPAALDGNEMPGGNANTDFKYPDASGGWGGPRVPWARGEVEFEKRHIFPELKLGGRPPEEFREIRPEPKNKEKSSGGCWGKRDLNGENTGECLGKRDLDSEDALRNVDGREQWSKDPNWAQGEMALAAARKAVEAEGKPAYCPGNVVKWDKKRAEAAMIAQRRRHRELLKFPWTSFAVREGHEIMWRRMQARDGRLWLGGSPKTFCPHDIATCGRANTTVFWARSGRAWLDSSAPGGQFLYLDPRGAVRYQPAGSPYMEPDPSNSGWRWIEPRNDILGYWYFEEVGEEKKQPAEFWACPQNEDDWQVFVNTTGFVNQMMMNQVDPKRSGCEPFMAMVNPWTGTESSAWEYV